MDSADALFREGRETQDKLGREFDRIWLPWLKLIIADRVSPVELPQMKSTGSEVLDVQLRNGTTLREHLLERLEDPEAYAAFRDLHSNDHSTFLYSLISYYHIPSHVVFAEPEKLLRTGFLTDLFQLLTKNDRDRFASSAEIFLLLSKNVIPASRTRILDGILAGKRAMVSAVQTFPAGAQENPLTGGYLAISSQLRDAISPR
jgi:hypothetical protein